MRFVHIFLILFPLLAACAETGGRAPPLTRIAFGSCLDQRMPQPVWQGVREFRPELFLFLGDNVYGDATSADMTELARAYATLGANPYFRALREGSRVLATWDDHDFGKNDAGAGFPWKRKAERLFLDFWEAPADDLRRARAGIYASHARGPPGRRVQVILLDTRYFRSGLRRTGGTRPKYRPDPDPGKTMLGAAQWAWLETELRKPADLRLVVSSIQVLADGHGWERWGNLPRERDRLFDLIRRTRANGVIILSGDRHFGSMYERRDALPYPLLEVTSSSLNRPWRDADEQGPRQTGPALGAENFGSVEIDWRTREVTISLRDLHGDAVQSRILAISDLAP